MNRSSWSVTIFFTGTIFTFVQDNHSRSGRGVLRGLRHSPPYGQWFGIKLSADNKKQLWITPGLAHGFLVTSDSADVLYKTTDYWAPEHERTILWSDPTLAIEWPLTAPPILSAKDAAGLTL